MTARVWQATLALLLGLALALGLWHGAQVAAGRIRAEERQRVLARVAAEVAPQLAAERAEWARERDSLEALVAQVDTVLQVRLRTIRDTLWLPADTTPVIRLAACRLVLDQLATDCTRYRETTAAALRVSAELRQADSLAAVALGARLALVRDSLARVQRERDRRPTWRLLGLTAGLSWLATVAR